MRVLNFGWRGGITGFIAAILASGAFAGFEEDYEAKRWEEVEIQLPPAPIAENLVSFYVSPTAQYKFMVDASSLTVGSDGVVRYVLVIEAPSGVRNVSYEGMRCETKERRFYASGRPDGSWSKARGNQWERVRDAVTNRHHAALFMEYFCPGGTIVWTADEARDALRRGGHPLVKRN